MKAINDVDDKDADFDECTEASNIEDTDFEEIILFDEEVYQIVSEYRLKSDCDSYVY